MVPVEKYSNLVSFANTIGLAVETTSFHLVLNLHDGDVGKISLHQSRFSIVNRKMEISYSVVFPRNSTRPTLLSIFGGSGVQLVASPHSLIVNVDSLNGALFYHIANGLTPARYPNLTKLKVTLGALSKKRFFTMDVLNQEVDALGQEMDVLNQKKNYQYFQQKVSFIIF